jgi:hypothetical protein
MNSEYRVIGHTMTDMQPPLRYTVQLVDFDDSGDVTRIHPPAPVIEGSVEGLKSSLVYMIAALTKPVLVQKVGEDHTNKAIDMLKGN